MASSTKTENYQLNQYRANDQPTWVGDYSGDMLKIDTALGNAAKRTGDKFNETETYAVGNLCIKDDLLYKFTAAKEAGAWDETKVKATTIEAEFEQLYGDITQLTEKCNKMGTEEILASGNFSIVGTTITLSKSYKQFRKIILVSGWDSSGSDTKTPSGFYCHEYTLLSKNWNHMIVPVFIHGKLGGCISASFKDDTHMIIDSSTFTASSDLGIRNVIGVY